MMIEALIYGLTPMAMMEKVDSPPPENRSSNPRNAFELNSLSRAALSAPGTAMCAKIRNTRKSPRVKRILRRSSGMRSALPIASNMA